MFFFPLVFPFLLVTAQRQNSWNYGNPLFDRDNIPCNILPNGDSNCCRNNEVTSRLDFGSSNHVWCGVPCQVTSDCPGRNSLPPTFRGSQLTCYTSPFIQWGPSCVLVCDDSLSRGGCPTGAECVPFRDWSACLYPGPSRTPSRTPTNTRTGTGTGTPSPTSSLSPGSSPSNTPSSTPTSSITATSSTTPSFSQSASVSPSPTPTIGNKDNTPVTINPQTPTSFAPGGGLSAAALTGIGIGALLLLCSIAAAIYYYRRAKKFNASNPKGTVTEWGVSSPPSVSSSSLRANSSFSAPGPVIEMGAVTPSPGALYPPPSAPPPPPSSPPSNSSQSTLAWANATASPIKPPPPPTNVVSTSNPFSSQAANSTTLGRSGLVSEELFYSTAGTAFLAAAEEMPLVGAVFAILGGLLLQVRNLSFATFEAGRLGQRLERLVSVVRQAGGDVAFAKRHAVLFESLLATLQELQGVLEKISARSTLKSFFLASTDLAQLEDSQQALSAHLIDFSAALQSEVLSAMRDLASNISSAVPSSIVATPISPPPPPFSMSFSLKDFTFSPSLQEQLAEAPRGSFGVVVFGIWKAHSTPVAIKLLKAENSGGLSAWLEEAELLRRLRENAPPNIVLLYGIGFDATHGYLVVMERLEGSLRDALVGYSRSNPRRHPALPVVMNWLKDTARGMVACHAAQVVHGDIKAANVLLSETRVAKLGDMGTARVTRGLDSTATRAGGTAGAGGSRGSPLWTAPELIDDPTMSASKSCDVFSWAVLGWEMLTELLPYHDESGEMTVNLEKLSSKLNFVKGTLRPDLSKVRGDAPPFLLTLLQRAWSSNPLERPTGEEIVAILEGAKASPVD